MNKFWLALAAASLAGVASAQVVIYKPVMSVADQHITLQGWGSGNISEADELAYEGTKSLRVSSRNFFQGGIMTFGQPVDLSQAYADKDNLFRLTFQAPDQNTVLGGGAAGGGKGPSSSGAGGGSLGGLDNGGGSVKGGGGGGGSQLGGGAGGQKQSGAKVKVEVPPLTMVRMIVTTTDGKKSEAYIPVVTTSKGERGWNQFAIPLQAISGFERTNKIVKELAFSGDTTATFYLGDLRIINDTTPISGEANIDRTNMALGDEGILTAYGNGGASVLEYQWDFDSDGQIDATGQYVKRKFRQPGDWTITLTIADKYGLKKPYTSQLKVHVNP